PLAPTSNWINRARLAPFGDGFLAVWQESLNSGRGAVKYSRLDREGHATAPATLVKTTPDAYGFVQLATEGDSAYILGYDSRELRLLRFDTDGTVRAIATNVPPSAWGSVMVATGGYVLFFRASTNVAPTVTVLDHEGTLIQTDLPIANPAFSFSGFDAAGSG